MFHDARYLWRGSTLKGTTLAWDNKCRFFYALQACFPRFKQGTRRLRKSEWRIPGSELYEVKEGLVKGILSGETLNFILLCYSQVMPLSIR
jgi:hypothetical protein